jgi:hypothetical protein
MSTLWLNGMPAVPGGASHRVIASAKLRSSGSDTPQPGAYRQSPYGQEQAIRNALTNRITMIICFAHP